MFNMDKFLGTDSAPTRSSNGVAIDALVSALDMGKSTLSTGMESFDDSVLYEEGKAPRGKDQSASTIYNQIKEAAMSAGLEGFIDNYGKEAGAARAKEVANSMVRSATLAVLTMKDATGGRLLKALQGVTRPAMEDTEDSYTKRPILSGSAGSVRTYTPANEEYDKKPMDGFWLLTVGFNFSALRQDAFAENLFPQTAVPPTKGGIVQEITYPVIFRDRTHQGDGSLWQINQRTLLDAIRDPSVLQNDSTRVYPVLDETSSALFVAESEVAADNHENLRGHTHKTGYLKFGVEPFDMLGLAKQYFNSGVESPDLTYAFDPAIVLDRILVKIGSQYKEFNVYHATQSKFQEKQTDYDRLAELSFKTETLTLTNKSTDITGKPLAATQSLADDETLALTISAHGTVNCSFGETDMVAGRVMINRYFSDSEDRISLKQGKGATVKEAFTGASLVGYKLNLRLVNTNQAERGLLMETRTFRHRLVMPFKYPITHVAPVTTEDQDAAAIIESLTMAVYVQNSIDAVKTLLNYADVVKEMATRDKKGILKRGDVDGILGHLFKPTYIEVNIDMAEKVDSLRSMDRFADVNAVLMNTIAAVLYPARRESNIDAAYKAHSKNQDEKPTWIINTDSNIVNYLMVQGDNRTLGPDMDYILNSTNNEMMDDKIIIVPTSKTRGENNPLTFGTFYHAPSIVTKLPQSRGNTHNLEYRVTPVNLHVPNQPFMVVINVKNLAKVISGSVSNGLNTVNGYTDGKTGTTTGSTTTQPGTGTGTDGH